MTPRERAERFCETHFMYYVKELTAEFEAVREETLSDAINNREAGTAQCPRTEEHRRTGIVTWCVECLAQLLLRVTEDGREETAREIAKEVRECEFESACGHELPVGYMRQLVNGIADAIERGDWEKRSGDE